MVFTSRISSDHTKTVDEYAVLIQDVLAIRHVALSSITGSIISSVVPNLSQTILSAVALLIGKEPIMVSNQIKTDLSITIDNPDQLGKDLIVNAVTALESYPTPIVIFDMGTATTVSVIDKQGNYAGGMIIPGVGLSLEALSNQASQLPHISLDAPPQIIKKYNSLWQRYYIWNRSNDRRYYNRIAADLGEMPTLLATGGWPE
ncbi:MAG: type III pantothenate kinase [Acutalibacteraceae bacterium]